jgi:hypothetical protein
MRERLEPVLIKVLSIGTAAVLVATLSALAVVRADNRTEGGGANLTASGGQSGGTSGGSTDVLGEQIDRGARRTDHG